MQDCVAVDMSQDIRIVGYTGVSEYSKNPLKKRVKNPETWIHSDIRVSENTADREEEEIEDVEIRGQWGTKIDALLRDLKSLLVRGTRSTYVTDTNI